MIRRSVFEATRSAKTSEVDQAEPVKVVIEPTKVAAEKAGKKEEYSKPPFMVGQEVVVIEETEFKEEDLVGEDGNKLSKEHLEKIKAIQKELNTLIKERKLRGKVFKEEGDYTFVDLGQEYSFTNSVYPLDAVFPEKKTFHPFKTKQLGGINNGEKRDKKESAVVSFFSKYCKSSISDLCESVVDKKRIILDYERRIKNLINELNDHRRAIIVDNAVIKLKIDEVKRIADGQTNDFDLYYAGMLKNPDIKSVEVYGTGDNAALLVTTEELEYSDEKKHKTDKHPFAKEINKLKFNIGGYKFLLFPSGQISASNYTKFLGTGYHHPCVNSSRNVCTGGQFGDAIKRAIQSGDFASAAHMMIDFLKRPETNNPYHDPANFLLMQNRKQKSSKESNWFSSGFCGQEEWNKKEYQKRLDELNEEMFGDKKEEKVKKVKVAEDLPF
jgi:hypothetical protein